jgi:baculoviral IAP repeat-containing protein 6
VSLPQEYPQLNPNVQFITTGGGQARFNPNLYADGKVCLSLLGTWSGPGWKPGESTLSQVLLSIQSAILVDQPFYNEPSFERLMHQDAGKRATAKHNLHLHLATLRHAMLDALRSPPRVGTTPKPACSRPHTESRAVLSGSPSTSVLFAPCVPQ